MADEILNNENTEDVLPEPILREEKYLSAIANNTAGGGGGGKVVIAEKSITANGTYNAVDDNANAYNPVTVNVANSYTAGDEGKVVSSGELVAQTSRNLSGEGTYDTTLNNEVTVSLPQPPTESDVNFYDYDGTLLYAYTAQEFLALEEMPPNPSHSGLTAEGWNWTFQEAKTFVNDNGKCDIGQMYTTSDGSTRLYIELPDGALTPYIYIGGQSGYGEANINVDWGDGNTETIVKSAGSGDYTPHTYNKSGCYTISIKATTGRVAIGNATQFYGLITNTVDYTHRRLYWQFLKGIDLGENVYLTLSSLDNTVFLKRFILSNNSTSNITLNTSYFICNGCFIVPRKYTPLNSSLLSGINKIILHPLMTQIYLGNVPITKVIIPANVTVRGFADNRFIREVILAEGSTQLFAITSSSIGLANSIYLSSLTIPSTISSLHSTGTLSYSYILCANLPVITFIKFKGTTPPTALTDTFANLPTSCKIYVPSGSLTAYTTASNYPDPNTYQYIEY